MTNDKKLAPSALGFASTNDVNQPGSTNRTTNQRQVGSSQYQDTDHQPESGSDYDTDFQVGSDDTVGGWLRSNEQASSQK